MKYWLIFLAVASTLTISLSGCSNLYYDLNERAGNPKRNIMQESVKDARNSQLAVKETFKTTLELLTHIGTIESSDLEKSYKQLENSYQDTDRQAIKLREQIAQIESVSKALFAEWTTDIKTYQSAELQRQSEAQLHDAQTRCSETIVVMKKAASKMEPIVISFHDRVLFLKHNLNNSGTIGTQDSVEQLEANVDTLIVAMDESIAQADTLLKNLQVASVNRSSSLSN
jgi:hypothetical protein